AQHGIGRRVAVLELAEVRLDLGLDEAAERLADQLVLLAPLDHAALPRSALRRQDGARLSLHAEQALLGEDRREPPALEPLERGRLLARAKLLPRGGDEQVPDVVVQMRRLVPGGRDRMDVDVERLLG